MITRTEHRTNGRATGSDQRTIGSLLCELTDESRTLLRQEIALAKAEITEKAARVGRNLAYLAIGAMIAYAGLLTLIFAAVAALVVGLENTMDRSIAAWLAPLLVGIVVIATGLGLAFKAVATLKNEPLTPEKTLDSLREDTQWLKERMT
jgi:sulfite exporter TauE/SafE